MFELFRNREDIELNLGEIDNLKAARKNLGDEMPVYIYRLFLSSIRKELEYRYGKKEMIDILRSTGRTSGEKFAKEFLNLELPMNEFIADLKSSLEAHKIGILRMEKLDETTGDAVITIGEDIDCSGLPVTGETVCNYDEGMLEGILREYTKKEYNVTEIDCWATGSRVCRFEAVVKK